MRLWRMAAGSRGRLARGESARRRAKALELVPHYRRA
jgi:hypothetical protein